MNVMTRRNAIAAIATAAVAPLVVMPISALSSSINWQSWRSDEKDFFRAPTLLTGDKDAILIDGSFNYPAGNALVEAIKASGKRLTTIYITSNDPDYYFSLKPVKAAFPAAKVIAASATIDAINANVEKKLAVWGPKLGEHGPQSLDDIVFAEPYDKPTLDLEGNTIEIVTSRTMHDRHYLWVPSLRAVVGGVYAFQGLHVWTADTATPKDRAAWIDELEALIARKPRVVVAGHAAEGVNNGPESLEFTRDYLLEFERVVASTSNSGELIDTMKKRYPGLGLDAALEIGAKVAKGEMKWG